MHKVWVTALLALVFACVPLAGSIDGKRFPCQVDNDCAGDGFVCIAGICRDPRDLALPDAAAADSGRDAGDVDRDAAADAGRDAAAADHDVGRDTGLDAAADAAPRDRHAFDQQLVDAGAADGAALDAGPDSGGDAALDAGCNANSQCLAPDGSMAICFSGRCGRLDPVDLNAGVTTVRSTSIAVDDQDRPAIAFDTTGTAAVRLFRNDGSAWAVTVIDTAGTLDTEPTLGFDPAGRAWVSYRRESDDKALVTYSGGAPDIAASYSNLYYDYERSSFAIDPATGAQHVLIGNYGDGLHYVSRTPATPDALPPVFGSATLALDGYYMRWSALFSARGTIYGTFSHDDRPHVGVVYPGIGFVSTYAGEITDTWCGQFGMSTSSSCRADQPVDLAVDSSGRVVLCSYVSDSASDYRVVYLENAGSGFRGDDLFNDTENTGYDRGARCAIVVDALDTAHVFYPKTRGGGGRKLMHTRVWHDDAGALQQTTEALMLGDLGQWPDAVVDPTGRLHLSYVKVTAPAGRNETTDITSSLLTYARLEWSN